ncbi:MAG: sulfur carrier protein ThiS [Phycisphaeraceae bacterium]|nr:sulfur carrier protein ThiS [Phycisphaeraceae bacterium]
MNIVVNGENTQVPEGASVRELIERLGLGQRACAAEVNESLVPRRDHEARLLMENDRVEIVTLVGGG